MKSHSLTRTLALLPHLCPGLGLSPLALHPAPSTPRPPPRALHPASSFLVVRTAAWAGPLVGGGDLLFSPLLLLSLLKRKFKEPHHFFSLNLDYIGGFKRGGNVEKIGKNNPSHHQEVLLTKWAAPHFTDEKAEGKREEKKLFAQVYPVPNRTPFKYIHLKEGRGREKHH